MARYCVEFTKILMRTATITVPDDIPQDDARDWAGENMADLFDVDEIQGAVNWDVDDLVDGESVKMSVETTFEDQEYELEGFKLASS